MAGFSKDLQEIPVTPSGVSPVPVHSNVASALQGLAQIATTGAGLYTDMKNEKMASNKAALEAQTTEATNALEDELLDTTIRGFEEAAPSGDPELTAGDHSVLSDAKGVASRLDAADRQGHSKTRLDLERVAAYRKYKAKYPHLAPELRDYFKKDTGKGVLQTLLEEENTQAEQLAKQDSAEKEWAISFAQSNNMYDPKDSHQDRMAKIMPLQNELGAAQAGQRTLAALQRQRDVSHEQRRKVQEATYRSAFPGFVVSTNLQIQDLLKQSGFDPQASNPQLRSEIYQQLETRRLAFEADVRSSLSDMDPTFLEKNLAVVNNQFSNAQKLVNGELTKETYTNSISITNAMAEHRLLQQPGMADKVAILEKFKGLNSDLLVSKTKVEFGSQVVMPIAKALLSTVQNPEHNPYLELKNVSGSAEETTSFYKDLVKVANANLDNPEAQEAMSNVLTAWSNEWQANPTDIPTGVYDQMLDVSSKPGFKEVLKKSAALPENFIQGMQEYSHRLSQKLSDDLSQDLGTKSPNFPKVSKNEDASLLDGYLNLTVQPNKTTLMEVLKVKFNKDGSVAWEPIPQARDNATVRRMALDVTRKYGQRVGKLVRSYAHTAQGDDNYDEARKALLSGSGFEPLQQLEFSVSEPKHAPDTFVGQAMDYLNNLPAIGVQMPEGPTAQDIYKDVPNPVAAFLEWFKNKGQE